MVGRPNTIDTVMRLLIAVVAAEVLGTIEGAEKVCALIRTCTFGIASECLPCSLARTATTSTGSSASSMTSGGSTYT